MNNITLHVKSVQKSSGEEPLEIEFITEGRHYQRNGYDYIKYEETELSGLEGHRTILRVGKDSVVMRRYGDMPVAMHFVVGQRNNADYYTPYGVIKIEYLTDEIDYQLKDDSGEVVVKYTLAMNGFKEVSHILNILYKVNLNDKNNRTPKNGQQNAEN